MSISLSRLCLFHLKDVDINASLNLFANAINEITQGYTYINNEISKTVIIGTIFGRNYRQILNQEDILDEHVVPIPKLFYEISSILKQHFVRLRLKTNTDLSELVGIHSQIINPFLKRINHYVVNAIIDKQIIDTVYIKDRNRFIIRILIPINNIQHNKKLSTTFHKKNDIHRTTIFTSLHGMEFIIFLCKYYINIDKVLQLLIILLMIYKKI